jgi:hypothetical protein
MANSAFNKVNIPIPVLEANGGTGGTGYRGLTTASGGQPTGIWGSAMM